MQINKGDKLVAVKSLNRFFDKGDVVKVTNVSEENDLITFEHDNGVYSGTGMMNITTCEQYFEKVYEKATPTVTQERIDDIMLNSIFDVQTVFDKCTVVSCQLPNGFVIVESSACVSPENYDEEMGAEICYDKIERKIWELEGYRLQEELYQLHQMDEMDECPCTCNDCDECPYDESPCVQ